MKNVMVAAIAVHTVDRWSMNRTQGELLIKSMLAKELAKGIVKDCNFVLEKPDSSNAYTYRLLAEVLPVK